LGFEKRESGVLGEREGKGNLPLYERGLRKGKKGVGFFKGKKGEKKEKGGCCQARKGIGYEHMKEGEKGPRARRGKRGGTRFPISGEKAGGGRPQYVAGRKRVAPFEKKKEGGEGGAGAVRGLREGGKRRGPYTATERKRGGHLSLSSEKREEKKTRPPNPTGGKKKKGFPLLARGKGEKEEKAMCHYLKMREGKRKRGGEASAGGQGRKGDQESKTDPKRDPK